MRAGLVFVGLFLVAATRALAQPPAIVLPESFVDHSAAHLPLSDNNGTFQDVIPEAGNRALARGGWAPNSRPISVGPLSMDIGSSDVGRDGKRAHFAHLHIDDFHPLGGNVSGTFDGRAATVRLSWPMGE
jgi:hypothetical protein